MKKSLFYFIPILLLLHSFDSFGQELQCEVNVNLESISSSQRDYLSNFKSDVERYLNSTRYTSEPIEEKIRCNFDIFFKTYSGNNQYTAQVFIASQRPIYIGDDKSGNYTPVLRIMDENWEFTYYPNQRLVQDDYSTDPLCDFLDFYAYIIIGFDCDTYIPLSGSRYFQKAFNVCQQLAATSAGKYWQQMSSSYNRYGLASELTNSSYDKVRIAMNCYYFDGLDQLGVNSQQAFEAILTSLETISNFRKQNPKSITIKQFFDSKYKEIADIFLAYPSRDVYDRLSNLDIEHRATYQEWKSKP
jgi:hypothetical protein